MQIAHQAIHIFRRAAKLKEQRPQDHHLHHKGDRRDDAEDFEPDLHRCPSRLTTRRNPVLPPYRVLRTSIRADTLHARLPLPPRWNPSCAPQLPCCARSIHRLAPEVRGPFSARNPCPRPLSSPNNRAYLPRTSEQTKFRPAPQPPAQPGNTSL